MSKEGNELINVTRLKQCITEAKQILHDKYGREHEKAQVIAATILAMKLYDLKYGKT